MIHGFKPLKVVKIQREGGILVLMKMFSNKITL